MDFHLKQWTENHHQHHQQEHDDDQSSALPLFSSEPTSPSIKSSQTFPKEMMGMGMGMGGYFSMGQWQELEVQAMIYRHMLTGSPIPPQLLHLLLNSNTSTSPFYSLPNFPPSLYQATGGGYWGRGGMDPEPGRCRRTDGKKWRCSRDVVAGHKYCERHIHRGRNRSRKPVEIPTPTTAVTATPGGRAGGDYSGGGGGGVLSKTTPGYNAATTTGSGGSAQPYTTLAAGRGRAGSLSGHSTFFDQLHLNNRRMSDSTTSENKYPFRSSHGEMHENEDKSSGGQTLRPFFDDWPRTVQEQEMQATHLSISVPGNASSDFSLKLSTGNSNAGHPEGENNGGRERMPSNWGMLWGPHHSGSMGGPLAEALRSSSTSNSSSPTSVLHQLQRGSATTSETSYIST